MKSKMKDRFLPINYEQAFYTNMLTVKQGDKSIEEHMEEFYKLTIRNQIRDGEAQLAARYKAGLRINIQLQMAATRTQTLDDMYQFALKFEETFKIRSSPHAGTQKEGFSDTRTASDRPRDHDLNPKARKFQIWLLRIVGYQ